MWPREPVAGPNAGTTRPFHYSHVTLPPPLRTSRLLNRYRAPEPGLPPASVPSPRRAVSAWESGAAGSQPADGGAPPWERDTARESRRRPMTAGSPVTLGVSAAAITVSAATAAGEGRGGVDIDPAGARGGSGVIGVSRYQVYRQGQLGVVEPVGTGAGFAGEGEGGEGERGGV